MVPAPQEPVRPLGVATTRPAGSVSVNATPVRPLAAFGLVSVNDRLVVPFNGIVCAPNCFVMPIVLTTFTLADAVLPVPPLVEVTEPLVLLFVPGVAPVTLTANEQFAFAAIVP